MQAGLFIPQGTNAEFAGWEASAAWHRSIAVARLAERLGFAAIWSPDHVGNIRGRTDAGADTTFESFVFLGALARETSRVTLGQLVICGPFRNAALIAKAISTLDVVSGGRAVCAIGAGWHRPEFDAYGYRFPPVAERLGLLREQLEVISRMLGPGRATYRGEHMAVADAPNEPKGLHRIPIVVGGNGPQVTWRLAARFADELNLDSLSVSQIAAALPVIASRCEEIGRDPTTLAVSGLVTFGDDRARRVDELARLIELGFERVDTIDDRQTPSDDWLLAYAEDLREAGVALAS